MAELELSDLKTEFEENYDIIRGGLAYFDDQIVLADGYGQVKVLSGIDGSIIWENNINLPILSAPIIYRGYIYFITLNNKIYAMDFTTGEVIIDCILTIIIFTLIKKRLKVYFLVMGKLLHLSMILEVYYGQKTYLKCRL